jgi:DNA-binding transcriptional LysR family regulator
LIVEFCALYPKIKFDLDASDLMVHLIESQMDLAIRIQPPPDNSDLIYRRLGENKLIFCASPSYLHQSKLPLKKIADLHLHPLIMFDAYLNCEVKGEGLTLRDFEKSRRVVANSGTFLTEMALQGAGIAVRSLWDIKSYLDRGELKRVLSKFEIINPQSIYAVVPGRRLMTSRVRLFLSFLEQKAKSWG